jgi:hypothetical protein
MSSYGRQVLQETGYPIAVSADGRPEWGPVGITLDWSTVAAVSGTDETYLDGTVVKVGAKGLPFGTILCRLGVGEVQTITIDATGGTFTITYEGQTTAAIAENATAAAVQAALEALSNIDPGDVVVTGSAGGPFTLTWDARLGNVAAPTTDASALTGGAGTAIVATITSGTNPGTWGPYDATATDGRQTLARGRCAILNMSVLQENAGGLPGTPSDHPPVFTGGLVFKKRLRVGGSGQPTLNMFEAAFPRITYVEA